jgi:histidyl-tRNA synthetase
VLGGGRYDGLIENLGGNPTPAVGWAAGIERLAMLVDGTAEPQLLISVIPDNADSELYALTVAAELRRKGVAVQMAFKGNAKRRAEVAKKNGADALLYVVDTEDEAELFHLYPVTMNRLGTASDVVQHVMNIQSRPSKKIEY